MALEGLLSALRSEAEEEIAQLEAESDRETEEVMGRARTRAREIEEEHLQAAEPGLRQEAERRLAQARLDASRHLREVRAEAIDELLAAVRERLSALPSEDRYRRVLHDLIEESRSCLRAGRIVRVDPRDEELARELVAEMDGGDLEVESALRSSGGIELQSDDGRVAVNTFEQRAANAEPLLRQRLRRRVSTAEAQPAKAATERRDGREGQR